MVILVAEDSGTNQNLILRQRALLGFAANAVAISHELTVACARQDAEQAAWQAHESISSARALGALKLAEVSVEIQSAGKAGNS